MTCTQNEQVQLYALRALPPHEAGALEAHLATCADCRRELAAMGPFLDAMTAWPTDVLRPPKPLWDRIAARISPQSAPTPPPAVQWTEPEWAEVAPGISCKILSTDRERALVSMLVRLAPQTDYPPHSHAGIEELHLLDGVLIVDAKTLYPGDYLRSELGTSDARVFSETGCTCLLMTSIQDELR